MLALADDARHPSPPSHALASAGVPRSSSPVSMSSVFTNRRTRSRSPGASLGVRTSVDMPGSMREPAELATVFGLDR